MHKNKPKRTKSNQCMFECPIVLNKFLEYIFFNLIFLEPVYAFLPTLQFDRPDNFIVDVFDKKR